MTTSHHAFTAQHYHPRAQDYVASAVHATGADLDQIETVLRGHDDARVLDLGCGGGHVSYRAALHVREVVACDITPGMLEAVTSRAEELQLANIRTQQAAAETLPFAAESFDFVLSRFSAHHWHGFEAGLREARRVLKPSGMAMFVDVMAPADPLCDTYLQAMEVLRDASHVRNYSLAEWAGALARSGFGVESVTTRKLRMEFSVWVARTATPEAGVQAIRTLQLAAPAAVCEHFRMAGDGSFDLEAVAMVVRPV